VCLWSMCVSGPECGEMSLPVVVLRTPLGKSASRSPNCSTSSRLYSKHINVSGASLRRARSTVPSLAEYMDAEGRLQ
jgi:hypothetical protein